MNSIRLAIHGAMLADQRRNEALARAVAAIVRPGDVVVDVGAGSAILAMLAARAGARRVYALELSSLALAPRELVRHNGLADVVEVEQCHSAHWDPPEPADAVVCETIGFAVFDEGFRGSLVDARERMLRPGGRLLPAAVRVLAAPVSPVPGVPDITCLDELCGLDFGPLAEVFRRVYQRGYFPRDHELSEPVTLWRVDCYTMTADEPLETEARFRVARGGILAGFVLWFEAELAPGIVMDNRSPDPGNHWGQALLPVPRRRVEPGAELGLRLALDDQAKRFTISWTEMTEKRP